MGLETKILMLNVLVATRVLLLTGPLTEQGVMCVYIELFVYTSINISVCNHLSLY